jgi:hypothetical protein
MAEPDFGRCGPAEQGCASIAKESAQKEAQERQRQPVARGHVTFLLFLVKIS